MLVIHTFAIDGVGIAIFDNVHRQPPIITVTSCSSFYPANSSIIQKVIQILSLPLIFFPFSQKFFMICFLFWYQGGCDWSCSSNI